MSSPHRCVLLSLALVGWLAGARALPASEARQVPAPGLDCPVIDLVAQLGSERVAERVRAVAALQELGEPALEPLRRLAATSLDSGVRDRARQVIVAIEEHSRRSTAFANTLFEVMETLCEGSVTGVKREELARYAVDGLYHSVGREVPPDLARRLGRVKSLKEEDARALLRDVHADLRPGKGQDDQVLLDRTIREMLSRVDPWATWTDRSRFIVCVDYIPVGPGLQLGWDARSRRVRVVSPVKDSPAHRAGVQAGDVITHIIQEGDEEDPCRVQVLSTRGWSIAEVANKLLGEPGTRVRFIVRREGVSKPLEFEVVRTPVELETVLGHHRRHDDNWDYLIDPVHRIGYVRLTGFRRNTARDLRRVLGRLNRQGLKGLILDLRFDPGGYLDVGTKAANLFVEGGLLLRIRPGAGREARFEARRQDGLVRCPVVCLVNADTAKMSEALAACLQDHRRALIVGERSRGNAGFQNIQPAEHYRELKFTTAIMMRPGGRKLDRIRMPGHGADEWGVTPDPGFDLPLPARERAALREYLDSLTVIPWRPPSGGDRPAFTDRQLALALGYLRARIR